MPPRPSPGRQGRHSASPSPATRFTTGPSRRTAASRSSNGCEAGSVRGTTWHGIFENDAFRRAFLRDLAVRAGRDFTPAPDVSFAAVRERRYDVLADLIAAHLDTEALGALIEGGVPAGLPTVVSGLAPA